MLPLLDSSSADFEARFTRLLARDQTRAREVETAVAVAIDAVRRDGDAALLDYTARFDNYRAADAAQLEVPRAKMEAALSEISKPLARALRAAARRIAKFHRREKQKSWVMREPDGSRLGQLVMPLERVGVYVPGGRAAYPSSALMSIIPAKVAGVGEVIMAAPAPGGELNPAVLAGAALAGADRVFTIGGAQAIAALAYGTASVPAVDKIVGPGNAYVAEAKRRVFGKVGIDVIAGPSEVVVICDRAARAEWVAADLFAQAEHDPGAQAVAITDSRKTADAVLRAAEKLLPQLPRREIISQSLAAHGAVIKAASLREAAELSNRIAPEHLELMVARPRALLPRIRHAGAIFLGAHNAEALGDYCAGPNHVLPTAGAARFSSPLGVWDFQKRSNLIALSRAGAGKLAPVAAELARCEGLDAHARAAECRLPR